MSGDGALDCIKRLAKVLTGKTEPSVEAVIEAARGVSSLAHNPVGPSLHRIYDPSAAEPVPDDICDLLRKIKGPRHYVPPGKGGNNGEGRNRSD